MTETDPPKLEPAPATGPGRALESSPATDPGRVLVTGCAGFLGSHLSERLVDCGEEVLGVDCFTDYYPREQKEINLARLRDRRRFTLRELDLGSDPLDDLVEGIDTVFHLAAQPGVRGSFGASFGRYVHDNVLATQRLLEASAGSRVQAFVYASSSSVYGNSWSYPTSEETERPRSPLWADQARHRGARGGIWPARRLAHRGLRYFTAYGPRQRPDMAFHRFCRALLRGEEILVYGDGRQSRDFTYIDDAIEANVRAWKRSAPQGVFNVGGGTQVRLLDAVKKLEELLGRTIEVEHLPDARGDVRRTCSDPRRAARDLGFSPRISLDQGLSHQAEWALARSAPRPTVVAV
jgi:nucleoside-diphosphate-sugar epimerase